MIMSDKTEKQSFRKSRRTVIKSAVGLGSIGAIGTSAAQNSRVNTYSGITYDTLTKLEGGDINAQIDTRGNNLTGNLDIAGYDIPLDQLSANESSRRPAFQGVLSADRFLESQKPLTVKIAEFDGSYAGLVSRPTGEFGILGFNLIPDSGEVSIDDIQRNSGPENKWTQSRYSFNIPTDGIPTSTGMHRIATLGRSVNAVSLGGE